MRRSNRASQAPFSARVTRSLGRSAINTAYQARQVGRGVSDVAHAVAFERHLAKAKRRQLAGDAKALLRRVGASADPRVIAGGFAGWTAGQVLGGAVGGVFGTLVGGPRDKS